MEYQLDEATTAAYPYHEKISKFILMKKQKNGDMDSRGHEKS